jgi:hypothetical protein
MWIRVKSVRKLGPSLDFNISVYQKALFWTGLPFCICCYIQTRPLNGEAVTFLSNSLKVGKAETPPKKKLDDIPVLKLLRGRFPHFVFAKVSTVPSFYVITRSQI